MSDTQSATETVPINTNNIQPNADNVSLVADGNPDISGNVETSSSMFDLLTTQNITIMLGFLGIYFIIYFVLSKVTNKEENQSGFKLNLGRTLDMLFLGILGIITYNVYQSHLQNPEGGVFQSGIFQSGISSLLTYITEPSSAFTTIMFIVIFYLSTYLFGVPMDSASKPIFISIFEGAIWLLLVVILFVDFFKYVLKISLYELFPFLSQPSLKPLPPMPDKPKTEKCETEIKDDPDSEVFNIANNMYTYEDAQAICKAYNSTLATYDQIERAYNDGAEWCNYGWSADQLILFPTQKKTWEKLQKLDEGRQCNSKTPSRKNNCGRPGINGGYIANPYARFGVNCFGKKPEPSDADKARMNANQTQVYPQTPKEQVLEKKVNYWKENANKYLQINSYSTNAWNKNDIISS